MRKLRFTLTATLALCAVAMFAPAGLASARPVVTTPALQGHARSGAIHWGAVRGTLQTYSAGAGATVAVNTTLSTGANRAATVSLKVGLSFKTILHFAGKTAPPFPKVGDGVLANLAWHKNAAVVTSLIYSNSRRPPVKGLHLGQYGSSRFVGLYDPAASSSTTLAVKDKYGHLDSFTIDADTVYFENGQQVATPTLKSGERLVVEASQQVDGSWLTGAVVIGNHPGDRGGVGQNEEFSGLYESDTTSTLTLTHQSGHHSRTFTVDANTRYFDQQGIRISSVIYTAGERLHVDAVEQTDGTWLALSVSVDDGHGHGGNDHGGQGENHTFPGRYLSSSATSVTVTDAYGNNDTFTINSTTLYLNHNGNPVSSLTYASREKLRITAARQPDGTWLATLVSAQTLANEFGQGSGLNENFDGTYQTNTAGSLTITDQDAGLVTFALTAGTKYFDQTGKTAVSLTYSAAEPLRVVGTQQPDGSWVADLVSAYVGNH